MFPAGILQPPFYHRHLPRSLNYGGIGVVIGHEITHGFDDKGRLFDEHGNLLRWWGDEAIDNFHQRAQCLISKDILGLLGSSRRAKKSTACWIRYTANANVTLGR